MGNLLRACNGGGGDERHIGELDAVLLLKAGLFAVAQADDAGHVDLVDGVDVGADAHALDHALGNDGAHLGEWHLSSRLVELLVARRFLVALLGKVACSTSSLLMRPSDPVPAIWLRSRLFSFAMRRTSGEERTRCPATCGAADCATGAAGCGGY